MFKTTYFKISAVCTQPYIMHIALSKVRKHMLIALLHYCNMITNYFMYITYAIIHMLWHANHS